MKKIFLLALGIPFLLASCGKPNTQENAATSGETKAQPQQETKAEVKNVKMILDLDTGVDDAMALAYALGHPNIDLIGVTTVYGNVAQQTSVENTLNLLDLLNHKDVPVFSGANKPIGAKDVYVADRIVKDIHGDNGVGNVILPKSPRQVEKQDAVDFIIESAKKYGKDLYIVATGPETTLAAALKKDPTLAEQVGKIVVMGGALIVEGNMNHYSEANIMNDPVAANEVFSVAPLTMVGLDVTHRTLLTKKDTQKWRDLGTASGKAYADIVDHYIDWEVKAQPILTGCALHDPLAVAVAMHPDYVKTLPLPMKVITTGDDRGRTIAVTEKLNDKNVNRVNVAVDVEVDTFVNDFNNTLTELFKKN